MTVAESAGLHGAGISVSEAMSIGHETFAGQGVGTRTLQALRPIICPFHLLVDRIPAGSSLLDAGCGSGLFIALLARTNRIRAAIGFDANSAAIECARNAQPLMPDSGQIEFQHRDARAAWPEGTYDVVSLIDVMHHVPPDQQESVIAEAAAHVGAGGLLVYKDMVSTPAWRAWANRLHDLIIAREWIHYRALDDVIDWATARGLVLAERASFNTLWYGHEWCVFRKPASGEGI